MPAAQTIAPHVQPGASVRRASTSMPQSTVRYPDLIQAARAGHAPAPVVGLGDPGTWLDPWADPVQADRLQRQISLARAVFRTTQGVTTSAPTLATWSDAMGWSTGLRGVALLPFVDRKLVRCHGYTAPFPVALGTLSVTGAPDVTPWVREFLVAATVDKRLANICLRCSPQAGQPVIANAPDTYRRLDRDVILKAMPGMPKYLSDAGDVLIIAPGFSSTAQDPPGVQARYSGDNPLLNPLAHTPAVYRLMLCLAADGTTEDYTSAAIAAYNVVGMVSAATTAADALQVTNIGTLRSILAEAACAAISADPRQLEASRRMSLRDAHLLPDGSPIFEANKAIRYHAGKPRSSTTPGSPPQITFEHKLNGEGAPKRLNDTYVRPNQMPRTDPAGRATSTYQAGHVTLSIKNVRERNEGLVLAGLLNEPL